MEALLIVLAIVIPLLAVLLGFLGSKPDERTVPEHFEVMTKDQATDEKSSASPVGSSGKPVLIGFLVIVLALMAATLYYYWGQIPINRSMIFLGVWLFVAMVAGMFVQVIAGNHADNNPLFDVTIDRIVWPLLFCIIVFYPIWVVGSSAESKAFALYSAFLNGFFWETVVKQAKVPTQKP
jgi:hypothetical protein